MEPRKPAWDQQLAGVGFEPARTRLIFLWIFGAMNFGTVRNTVTHCAWNTNPVRWSQNVLQRLTINSDLPYGCALQVQRSEHALVQDANDGDAVIGVDVVDEMMLRCPAPVSRSDISAVLPL
jgi:hypothetical protein